MSEIQEEIERALEDKAPVESDFLTPQKDNFCSGLVTRMVVVERRLYSIPFETCLISHSGIVCETTRGRAYLIEYVEDFPILIHDVTSVWSFKPTNKFFYGGYEFTRQYKGVAIPTVSYTVQYVAKLFQCSADMRGEYLLSGNNCHMVQEHIRYTLGIAASGELHYGTCVRELELEFDPLTEMKPYYYM
ncbi:Conserved_hypothetical protein [Hexamita inflata]|uniref:Uncharacterized protein n=1 Tax=Hexamita inflata TaxID=28002 RepID=A0AA86UP07_9EUKA|nr:Conserved hypothetical protein [Hexamita inflata]CAI9932524.1 Conserved hypothetical protein [Hexamita inflata]CAI9965980.1 Conserved hypothetical protein [Hexamita inflata]